MEYERIEKIKMTQSVRKVIKKRKERRNGKVKMRNGIKRNVERKYVDT